MWKWKNIIVCLVCVCDFYYYMEMKRMLFYWTRETKKRKKKKKKREGQNGGPIGEKEFSLVNGSHNLKLIYKRTTQQHYLKI